MCFRTKERQNSNFEKLKCILSYFDRVTDPESDEGTSPSQTVSFHRRCLNLDEVRPQWEKIDTKLTKLVQLCCMGTLDYQPSNACVIE